MSKNAAVVSIDKAMDAINPVTASDRESASASNHADDERLQWADISAALTTQARVVHALMLRETISRYGDHKLGFLWAVIEPLLFVALVAGTMAAMRSDSPGGMPLIPFMITGIVPFFMFRNTMNQLRGAVSSNRTLLGFPQVTIFDVIIARALLESAVMLFVFVFILSMAHLVGYEIRVENPLGVLLVCISILILGSGLGFLLATISPIVPSTGQVAGLLFGRPLFLTSGLFFTAGSIPEPVRGWLLYNPLLQLIELMRSYFFYEFESEYGDWFYTGFWVVGMLAFGMLTYQALKRRAIVGL